MNSDFLDCVCMGDGSVCVVYIFCMDCGKLIVSGEDDIDRLKWVGVKVDESVVSEYVTECGLDGDMTSDNTWIGAVHM